MGNDILNLKGHLEQFLTVVYGSYRMYLGCSAGEFISVGLQSNEKLLSYG